jgi:hypothetical protein
MAWNVQSMYHVSSAEHHIDDVIFLVMCIFDEHLDISIGGCFFHPA